MEHLVIRWKVMEWQWTVDIKEKSGRWWRRGGAYASFPGRGWGDHGGIRFFLARPWCAVLDAMPWRLCLRLAYVFPADKNDYLVPKKLLCKCTACPRLSVRGIATLLDRARTIFPIRRSRSDWLRIKRLKGQIKFTIVYIHIRIHEYFDYDSLSKISDYITRIV